MCSYPDILNRYNIKMVPYEAKCYSKFPSPITADLYHFQSVRDSTFNSSLNNLTSNSGNVLVFNVNISEDSILNKLR